MKKFPIFILIIQAILFVFSVLTDFEVYPLFFVWGFILLGGVSLICLIYFSVKLKTSKFLKICLVGEIIFPLIFTFESFMRFSDLTQTVFVVLVGFFILGFNFSAVRNIRKNGYLEMIILNISFLISYFFAVIMYLAQLAL